MSRELSFALKARCLEWHAHYNFDRNGGFDDEAPHRAKGLLLPSRLGY